MRRSVSRILGVLAAVAVLVAAGVMVQGLRAWPTAPIRFDYARGGYVDKRGTVRTAEEFARFKEWERTLLASFAAAFALGFAAAALAPPRQRAALSAEEAEALAGADAVLARVLPERTMDEIRASTPLGHRADPPRSEDG